MRDTMIINLNILALRPQAEIRRLWVSLKRLVLTSGVSTHHSPISLVESQVLIVVLLTARSSLPTGHSSTSSSFRTTQPSFVPHFHSTIVPSNPSNYGVTTLEQQPIPGSLLYTQPFAHSPLQFRSSQYTAYGQLENPAVTQSIPSASPFLHPGLYPPSSQFFGHNAPAPAFNSSEFTPIPFTSPSSNEFAVTGNSTQERSYF